MQPITENLTKTVSLCDFTEGVPPKGKRPAKLIGVSIIPRKKIFAHRTMLGSRVNEELEIVQSWGRTHRGSSGLATTVPAECSDRGACKTMHSVHAALRLCRLLWRSLSQHRWPAVNDRAPESTHLCGLGTRDSAGRVRSYQARSSEHPGKRVDAARRTDLEKHFLQNERQRNLTAFRECASEPATPKSA
jgi:hypothetical protein